MSSTSPATQEKITGLASISKAFETLMSRRPGVLASESGGELSWLKKARERDALRWQSLGLPSRKSERWKYTSLNAIEGASVVLPESSSEAARGDFAGLSGEIEAEIVFLNGSFKPEWSKWPSQKGVTVTVLSELFDECVNDGWSSERMARFAGFRAHVESSDADRETVFAAMNTSFMQDGVLINIEPGVVVKNPIVVSALSDSGSQNGELPLASPRIFTHVQKGASAGLVELYSGRGPSASYLTNAVSDLRLEEGARLSHCKVQMEHEEAVHIGTTRVHQQRDSFIETFQFSFGARLSRQDLHVSLEGENAESVLDGLYIVGGRQHVDNYTLVEHVVPHTTSDQLYKGILDGEARAVFNGHVRIHRDAMKANAAQKNSNLVLSAKAEVDTKPELEIDADDVKASHGATIGQIDPDHLFYLESRAISRDEAIRMLSRGFAQDVVFRIRNEKIRAQLKALVDLKFESLSIGGGNA